MKSQKKEFYRFYGIFLSLLIRPVTEWKKYSSKGFYSQKKIPARSFDIFYVFFCLLFFVLLYLLCLFCITRFFCFYDIRIINIKTIKKRGTKRTEIPFKHKLHMNNHDRDRNRFGRLCCTVGVREKLFMII